MTRVARPGVLAAVGAVSVAALVSTACALEAPAAQPLPVGDPAVFSARAQPALDGRCAEPSCHGDADRPLAVFSPGRRRADPSRLHLIEPLTAEELAANARALAAFALDPLLAGAPIADCLVLCKPLALAAGGCGHAVGDVFAGSDDRDYQGLRAYLETMTLPEPP